MKNPIEHLNKTFDNQIRLGIMSFLMVNDELSFVELKEQLDVSDGNLATHLKKLDESNYIKTKKRFEKNKPLTTYAVSTEGRKAFTEHIKALEYMIKQLK